MGTLPDINNIVKVSQFFDCSIDYLMDEERNGKGENKQFEDKLKRKYNGFYQWFI